MYPNSTIPFFALFSILIYIYTLVPFLHLFQKFTFTKFIYCIVLFTPTVDSYLQHFPSFTNYYFLNPLPSPPFPPHTMLQLQTPSKLPTFTQMKEQAMTPNTSTMSNTTPASAFQQKVTLPPLSSILSSAQSNHYKDHPLTMLPPTSSTNTSANASANTFPTATPYKKQSPIESYSSTPIIASTPYYSLQHLHSFPITSSAYHSQPSSFASSTSSLLLNPSPPPPLPYQQQQQSFANVDHPLFYSNKRAYNSSSIDDSSIMDTSILELRKSKSMTNTSKATTSTSSTLSASASAVRPASTVLVKPTTSPTSEKAYAFISHSPATYPSQEPAIDNAPLARRKRRRTSPHELNLLNKEFEIGTTPNKMRRIEIAKKVHMTEKAVQIWFQNKRQSIRKQSSCEKEVLVLPMTNVSEQQQQQQQQQQQHQTIESVPTVSTSLPSIVSSTPSKPHITTVPQLLLKAASSTPLSVTIEANKPQQLQHGAMIETNKKQPTALNGNTTSTMTFKLIPNSNTTNSNILPSLGGSKVTQKLRMESLGMMMSSERKVLGDITNRM